MTSAAYSVSDLGTCCVIGYEERRIFLIRIKEPCFKNLYLLDEWIGIIFILTLFVLFIRLKWLHRLILTTTPTEGNAHA